jgi:hypothetical protein
MKGFNQEIGDADVSLRDREFRLADEIWDILPNLAYVSLIYVMNRYVRHCQPQVKVVLQISRS